eukprot:1627036-Rhodomonas_salina.1
MVSAQLPITLLRSGPETQKRRHCRHGCPFLSLHRCPLSLLDPLADVLQEGESDPWVGQAPRLTKVQYCCLVMTDVRPRGSLRRPEVLEETSDPPSVPLGGDGKTHSASFLAPPQELPDVAVFLLHLRTPRFRPLLSLNHTHRAAEADVPQRPFLQAQAWAAEVEPALDAPQVGSSVVRTPTTRLPLSFLLQPSGCPFHGSSDLGGEPLGVDSPSLALLCNDPTTEVPPTYLPP